jgi:hypothetical protein
VQQGSAKESKTRGTSGRGLQMVFDFSDPGSVSLKTSKDISVWGCPTSSKTWQEWVTERRGAYSARLNAERRTSASGCSSWRTPNSQLIEAKPHGTKLFGRTPADPQVGLADQVANWPSPVASEVRQGFQDRSRGMKGSQESLTTVVVKTWATPSAREWKGHTITEAFPDGFNVTLSNQVHGPAVPASSSTDGSRQGLWQTATVSTGAHRQKDGSMTAKLDRQVNGKLNPRWVETLMGLPVGWTMPSCASPVTIERMSSDFSETVSSQQQRNEPSEH